MVRFFQILLQVFLIHFFIRKLANQEFFLNIYFFTVHLHFDGLIPLFLRCFTFIQFNVSLFNIFSCVLLSFLNWPFRPLNSLIRILLLLINWPLLIISLWIVPNIHSCYLILESFLPDIWILILVSEFIIIWNSICLRIFFLFIAATRLVYEILLINTLLIGIWFVSHPTLLLPCPFALLIFIIYHNLFLKIAPAQFFYLSILVLFSFLPPLPLRFISLIILIKCCLLQGWEWFLFLLRFFLLELLHLSRLFVSSPLVFITSSLGLETYD